MVPLELFVAGRYLRAKRKEGFISLISLLSVAGVMVGVMALVIVIAVMSGAETEFRRRILGVEPHILVMEYSGRFNDHPAVLKKIASLSTSEACQFSSNTQPLKEGKGSALAGGDRQEKYGITAVSPLLFGQSMIRTAAGLSGAVIRGIDPTSTHSMVKGYTPTQLRTLLGKKKDGEIESMKKNGTSGSTSAIIHGSVVNSHDSAPAEGQSEMKTRASGAPIYPGIILGNELAVNLGVTTGDKVILMSTGGMLSPVGHMPSMKRFEVVGLFESGMYEYDSSLAYMHLKDAQTLMGMGSRISAMGVWVEHIFDAATIKAGIVETLQYPYYARDWMEINKSLFSALKLEKTAMFVILTLIILVAAFNIASALIMMVMEKTRDIAVFKAMGATDGLVRKIFMLQGMMIGLLGTFLGTLAGVGICLLLETYHFIELPAAYPFSTLPVQLESTDVVMIAVASVAICFFSTLYPSHKASKMNPVEALRYG